MADDIRLKFSEQSIMSNGRSFVNYMNQTIQLKKYFFIGLNMVILSLAIGLTVVAVAHLKKTESPMVTTSAPITPDPVDPFGDGPWQNELLTDSIIPNDYMLTVRFYPDINTYEGTVDIQALNTKANNSVIVLHAANLKIEDPIIYLVQNGENVQLTIESSFMYTKHDYFVIKLRNGLKVNAQLLISIQFERPINQEISKSLFMETFKANEYEYNFS